MIKLFFWIYPVETLLLQIETTWSLDFPNKLLILYGDWYQLNLSYRNHNSHILLQWIISASLKKGSEMYLFIGCFLKKIKRMMQTFIDWATGFLLLLAKKNDSVCSFLGRESKGRIMNHWFTSEFSKCGLQTCSGNITWKFVRNVNSWAPFQTNWNHIFWGWAQQSEF